MDSYDKEEDKNTIKNMSYVYSDNFDKYNTEEKAAERDLYERVTNSNLRIKPKKNQLWKDYMIELKIHIDVQNHRNYQTHVIKGVRGRPWYTHTRGDGCFMCTDMEMHLIMYEIMLLMTLQYPENRF